VLITGSLDSKYIKIADIINKQDLIGGYFESNSIGEVMSNEIYKLVNPAFKRKIEMIYTSNKSKNEYIDLLAYDIENNKIRF
jgi:acetyl-CoA carboxylase beta subunit